MSVGPGSAMGIKPIFRAIGLRQCGLKPYITIDLSGTP